VVFAVSPASANDVPVDIQPVFSFSDKTQ